MFLETVDLQTPCLSEMWQGQSCPVAMRSNIFPQLSTRIQPPVSCTLPKQLRKDRETPPADQRQAGFYLQPQQLDKARLFSIARQATFLSHGRLPSGSPRVCHGVDPVRWNSVGKRALATVTAPLHRQEKEFASLAACAVSSKRRHRPAGEEIQPLLCPRCHGSVGIPLRYLWMRPS